MYENLQQYYNTTCVAFTLQTKPERVKVHKNTLINI